VISVEKENIRTLLFFKQGRSKVSLHFEKDAYMPNEEIIINCGIENE